MALASSRCRRRRLGGVGSWRRKRTPAAEDVLSCVGAASTITGGAPEASAIGPAGAAALQDRRRRREPRRFSTAALLGGKERRLWCSASWRGERRGRCWVAAPLGLRGVEQNEQGRGSIRFVSL
jgi:hypothetical protein